MNKIKLFAGALTFMTTMAPPIHVYAATASHAELNAAAKNIDLDKSVNLQNSINLTDEIAKENQDSNISRNIAILEEQISDYRNISQYRHFIDMECVRKLDLLHSLDHTCCKNRKSRCKEVQRRTADGLICFHIDRSKCMQKTEQSSGQSRYQHGEQEQSLTT